MAAQNIRIVKLQLIDWVIIVASLLICFVSALFFSKCAAKDTSEFFASGSSVPWWTKVRKEAGVSEATAAAVWDKKDQPCCAC